MSNRYTRQIYESQTALNAEYRAQMDTMPAEDTPDMLATRVHTPVPKPSFAPRVPTELGPLEVRLQISQQQQHEVCERKEARILQSKEDIRRGYEAFIARLQAEIQETKRAHDKLLEATGSRTQLQEQLASLTAELEAYRSEHGGEAVKRLKGLVDRLSEEKLALQHEVESSQKRVLTLQTRLTRVYRETSASEAGSRENLDKLGAVYNKLLDSYNSLCARAENPAEVAKLRGELESKMREIELLLQRNKDLSTQVAKLIHQSKDCGSCKRKDETIKMLSEFQTRKETPREIRPRSHSATSFTSHCGYCQGSPVSYRHQTSAPELSPARRSFISYHAPPSPTRLSPHSIRMSNMPITVNNATVPQVHHSFSPRPAPGSPINFSYRAQPALHTPKSIPSTPPTASPNSVRPSRPTRLPMPPADPLPARKISLLNSDDYREIVKKRKVIDELFGKEVN